MSQTDINQIDILIKQHEEQIELLKSQRDGFQSELDNEDTPEPATIPELEQVELSDEEQEQVDEEKKEAEEDDSDDSEVSDQADSTVEVPKGQGDPNELVEQAEGKEEIPDSAPAKKTTKAKKATSKKA